MISKLILIQAKWSIPSNNNKQYININVYMYIYIPNQVRAFTKI